tara:strand:+ start:3255 stop:3590 length:336 start_codon:yes stop_codon:yes gene_type:complete
MYKKTKSSRLRNTAIVYNKTLKLLEKQNDLNKTTKCIKKSPLVHPKKETNIKSPKKETTIKSPKKEPYSKENQLNSYQLFVRAESKKKDIYEGMNAKERMQKISQKWKNNK